MTRIWRREAVLASPHVCMLIDHGARGDIADADGRTAAQIMRRKQDPELRAMAEQLATGGGVAAG
jgi:hypothetical protein